MTHWHQMWKFDTAEFRIVAEITECLDNPREQFSDDADIEAIENHRLDYFDSRVRVLRRVRNPGRVERFIELGNDYLGGSAYDNAKEFFAGHRDPDALNRNCSIMRGTRGNVNICHYFPDMVRTAIDQARDTLKQLNAT